MFASVAKFSETLEARRIDPEYFDPQDVGDLEHLSEKKARPLGEIATLFHGKAAPEYVDDGVLAVVRAGDLTHVLIHPACGADFLRADAWRLMFRLQNGDILISSIGMGSIGKVSIVMDAADLLTVPEVTVVRSPEYSPAYLLFYLSTPLGQRMMLREVTGGTGQQHLLKDKAARVLVPPPPAGLEKELTELCDSILLAEKQVASLYAAGRGAIAAGLTHGIEN